MDKEQLLLEVARLKLINEQNFEVIRGYQEQIQKNLRLIEILAVQLSQLS